MPVIEGTTSVKSCEAEYDFAVDAGAIGTITLRAAPGSSMNNLIPAGAVITHGYLDVLTLFTTGTAAQMALTSGEGAGDLIAATVVSGAPYSTTGRKSIIPVATGATAIKTTAARSIQAVISVGTVTAGKFRIVLFYR